jgi:hypothetical protein
VHVNILRHIRKHDGTRRSAFAEVLPRVRRIREQCQWQSFIRPGATEQRMERVVNARKRIVYRPCIYEPIAEWINAPPQAHWLRLAVFLFFLVTVSVWVWLVTD